MDREAPAGVTRHGRTSTAACYFASFVALGIVVASLGPTLPGLAALTRSRLAAVSGLFVARQIGYLAGTLGGGRAYDRFAGHPVLVAVFASLVAALALAPAAPALWAVTAALAVVGVAEGMIDVGVNTLIVWEFRERAGPRLNALHACFGVGACLSPIVIQVASASGGVAWAYRALAILLLPLPAWLALLPSPARAAHADDGRPPSVDWRLVALVALFFLVYVGSEAAVGGWAFTYTISMGLGGEAAGAYLTSAFWGALAVGRTATIPLAMRVRPEAILAAAISGGLASVLLVVVVPGSLVALWAGTLCAGFALAAVFPTTLALAGRHLPVTGAVNSWFFGAASLGAMGLPWLIGQFFEGVGPRVTFWFVAADLLASLAILGVIVGWIRRGARGGR